jgi:hypothetical protein
MPTCPKRVSQVLQHGVGISDRDHRPPNGEDGLWTIWHARSVGRRQAETTRLS